MAYSALLLLMLGILANHHYMALALDDLALFADQFHGRSYLHRCFLLSELRLAAPGDTAPGEVVR